MTMLDTTPDHPYAAGIVRFPTSGPEWYENTSHVSRGFDTSIAPLILPSGRLQVQLITPMPVEYAAASGDETFAERGLLAGVSSGVGEFNIAVGLNIGVGQWRRLRLDHADDYEIVAGQFTNLWLYAKRVPPLPA